MSGLVSRHCSASVRALDAVAVNQFLADIHDWRLDEAQQKITRRFEFKNYYQTIAFVNAVATIANTEDHHPDMEVSYGCCVVWYNTHSVGGLSENDFICAAKIDALSLE